MQVELTEEQVNTILSLVRTEMNGICGDIGYSELSKIKNVLEQELTCSNSTSLGDSS
ncbi:hypothetical protein VCHA43P273_90146 [Vibrio chagasii]|nr:hypothetical protein VCHA43P273_90146 [Vibrio chagasii]CAK2978762.1 hypothetical protein VCRA219O19_60018 [Vibrio crassostreae]